MEAQPKKVRDRSPRFEFMAKLLKSKRMEKGLSQKDMALKMGSDNAQYVSNLERGVNRIPLDRLVRLQRILKISQKEILDALVFDYREDIKKQLKNERARTRQKKVKNNDG